MSYFKFSESDIINTFVSTHPSYTVELNGDQVTGSVYLDKPFLTSSLEERTWRGSSDKEGGLITKTGPFTASVDIIDVESGATNSQLYKSVLSLFNYYHLRDPGYVTGSGTSRFRVITIPEIYYDREILTGSFTASDIDNAGDSRIVYDNGRGGIYSGSLTGTLVGNIFYSEGLVALWGGGLNDEAGGNDFGEVSTTNFKWRVNFKGNHKIPTKIFRCRAPAGQLNASGNPSFYYVAGSGSQYNGDRVRILSQSVTYITKIGLYNDRYELVGVAHLAQPIRKTEENDLLFRAKIDF